MTEKKANGSLRRLRALLAAAIATLLAPAPALAASGGADELSSRLDQLAGRDLRSAPPGEQGRAVSLLPSGPGSLLRDGGKLVVDIRVSGDVADRAGGIEAAGAVISASSATDHLIEASVGEADLRAVGDAPGVEAVTEVLAPLSAGAEGTAPAGAGPDAINACAPGVISEGDAQLRAATARNHFDVDGTGVKVGVLSDSFDLAAAPPHAAADVASGDLPGPGNPCGRTTPVQVLADNTPSSHGDEGRAMAQIVHDIAPGASLTFATADTGDVSFANNIRALANAGADVIADDYLYFNEPFFQDGIIANAVTDVSNQGVAYFTAAFNNNRLVGGNDINSWEAPAYRPTTCPAAVAVGGADCMDFDPTAGTDNTFNITANSGKLFRFVLQWAEPQNGVGTDLDLFVINSATAAISQSIDVNATTGKPFEFVSFSPDNSSAGNYQLIVRRTSGTSTPRLKWINADNNSGSIAGIEYPTSAGGDIVGPTIYGHDGAAAAQSLAAVFFAADSLLESYSSRGPVTHYFAPADGITPAAPLGSPEVLNKPDVAATDGTINTFFGQFCPACRFFGTSASSPHAAGVAALQLEANPALSAEQVKQAQRATARPVGTFGPLAAGAGLIDARAAIGSEPTPPPTAAASAPELTNDPTPTITVTTTGDLASESCSVDGGAGQACSGTFTPSSPLGDGRHTVTVTATDHFGQSASGSATVTVDTKVPKVKVKKGPKKKSAKRKAKFKFAVEPGAKLECKLDKGKFGPCKTQFKVKPGKHKLFAHATDAAGNRSKDVKYRWKVTK